MNISSSCFNHEKDVFHHYDKSDSVKTSTPRPPQKTLVPCVGQCVDLKIRACLHSTRNRFDIGPGCSYWLVRTPFFRGRG